MRDGMELKVKEIECGIFSCTEQKHVVSVHKSIQNDNEKNVDDDDILLEKKSKIYKII